MYIALFCGILNIAMLFYAALIGFPSSTYYFVLRFLTFFISLGGAALVYNTTTQKYFSYVYGVIALLFNPFFPFRLHRSTWITIDFITGVLLIYVVYCLIKDCKIPLMSFKTLFIIAGLIGVSVLLIVNGSAVNSALNIATTFFLAVVMSLAAFAMGSLLYGQITKERETVAIVLLLIFTTICALVAFNAWASILKTIGII